MEVPTGFGPSAPSDNWTFLDGRCDMFARVSAPDIGRCIMEGGSIGSSTRVGRRTSATPRLDRLYCATTTTTYFPPICPLSYVIIRRPTTFQSHTTLFSFTIIHTTPFGHATSTVLSSVYPSESTPRNHNPTLMSAFASVCRMNEAPTNRRSAVLRFLRGA